MVALAGVNPKPGGAAEVLNQAPEASTVETPIGAANGDSGPQPNDDSLPVQHAGGDRGAPEIQGQPGPVAGTPSRTSATGIEVPGSERAPYQAKYVVRELSDVTSSHNGLSFAPNEKYGLINDRDYTLPENQGKVMVGSNPAKFNPRFFINNSPDMGSGPPAIDTPGQVLGGNGRTMMLQRTFAYDPKGAQAYHDLLMQDADLYGQDPAQIQGMKQPVLLREIGDAETPTPEAKQRAVTDFNVSGTADLTPAENAMADSRRVSQATRDDIGRRMNALGSQATLAQVLGGAGGVDVLNSMIRDGVINQQEVAAYKAGDALTDAGKTRISQALTGRFYSDTKQMAATPINVRTRIERIAGPLTDLDADQKWTLTPTIHGALDLLSEARAAGNNLGDFLSTPNLMGRPAYSPAVVRMAKVLNKAPLPQLKDAVEIYARDAATDAEPEGMFGKPAVPEPAASFTRAVKVAKLNAQESELVGAIRKLGETADEELSDAGKATRDSKLEAARQGLADVRAKRAAL